MFKHPPPAGRGHVEASVKGKGHALVTSSALRYQIHSVEGRIGRSAATAADGSASLLSPFPLAYGSELATMVGKIAFAGAPRTRSSARLDECRPAVP